VFGASLSGGQQGDDESTPTLGKNHLSLLRNCPNVFMYGPVRRLLRLCSSIPLVVIVNPPFCSTTAL